MAISNWWKKFHTGLNSPQNSLNPCVVCEVISLIFSSPRSLVWYCNNLNIYWYHYYNTFHTLIYRDYCPHTVGVYCTECVCVGGEVIKLDDLITQYLILNINCRKLACGCVGGLFCGKNITLTQDYWFPNMIPKQGKVLTSWPLCTLFSWFSNPYLVQYIF